MVFVTGNKEEKQRRKGGKHGFAEKWRLIMVEEN
jgi:hypothetical protein